ncbi:MAG: hypothetical protein PF961_14450 [Planctomycetota bacterium]|jgi:hypothetical protein|nr:hypothetical protein [Planctomycetota bacterium]
MRNALVFLSAAVVALGLIGCGGGSSSRSAASAPVDVEPEVVDNSESGIPGLTVSQVAQQPSLPALPGSFGPETTRDEVAMEARSVAAYELKRKQLGELTADQRVLFLEYKWWAQVREIQRSQASHIEGLTVGELEDQTAAPPLPAMFNLETTTADLSHHAFMVAREEKVSGVIGDLAVEPRQKYLVWAWSPLLEARKAKYRQALAERGARHDYQLKDAKRKAAWQHDIDAYLVETERMVEIEKRKTIPVLTPEEKAELDAIGQR